MFFLLSGSTFVAWRGLVVVGTNEHNKRKSFVFFVLITSFWILRDENSNDLGLQKKKYAQLFFFFSLANSVGKKCLKKFPKFFYTEKWPKNFENFVALKSDQKNLENFFTLKSDQKLSKKISKFFDTKKWVFDSNKIFLRKKKQKKVPSKCRAKNRQEELFVFDKKA